MGLIPMANKELASNHKMHRKTAVCMEGMQGNDLDTPTMWILVKNEGLGYTSHHSSRLLVAWMGSGSFSNGVKYRRGCDVDGVKGGIIVASCIFLLKIVRRHIPKEDKPIVDAETYLFEQCTISLDNPSDPASKSNINI